MGYLFVPLFAHYSSRLSSPLKKAIRMYIYQQPLQSTQPSIMYIDHQVLPSIKSSLIYFLSKQVSSLSLHSSDETNRRPFSYVKSPRPISAALYHVIISNKQECRTPLIKLKKERKVDWVMALPGQCRRTRKLTYI